MLTLNYNYMKKMLNYACLCVFVLIGISACEKAGDVIIEEVEEIVTPGLEIRAASISPTLFSYGQAFTFSAHVTDSNEELSALEVTVKVNGRTMVTRKIALTGTTADVTEEIVVPFTDNAPEGMVKFALKVINAKGNATTGAATATVKRPDDNTLYMVLGDGTVYSLTKSAVDANQYENNQVILSELFNYRIAQKMIQGTNQIDYSGFVIGSQNGKTQVVNESGNPISATLPLPQGADYIASFAFDLYAFQVASFSGGTFSSPNIVLDSRFVAQTISSENFLRARGTTLTKDESYWIYGELASPDVIWNVDFFDRMNNNQVKFTGETSDSYTLYYNPVRKNVLIAPENPSNGAITNTVVPPLYLPGTGDGMGYPTKLTSSQISAAYSGRGRVTTGWGFDNILNYVIFRQIETDVYQTTVYMPGDHDHYLGLGMYNNNSWSGQQNAREYTITSPDGIVRRHNSEATDISFYIYGPNDGFPTAPSDFYRLTLDIAAKTLIVEKYDINTYSVVTSTNPVTRDPVTSGVEPK
jgi:hypothetical protein